MLSSSFQFSYRKSNDNNNNNDDGSNCRVIAADNINKKRIIIIIIPRPINQSIYIYIHTLYDCKFANQSN